MFYRVPFLRFTFSLIIGIIFFEYVVAPRYDLQLFKKVLLVGIIVLAIVYLIAISRIKVKGLRGVIFLGFFLLGSFCSLLHELSFRSAIQSLEGTQYDSYMAEVSSLPEKREKSYRLECNIIKLRSTLDGKWVTTDVKALVNIPINSTTIPDAGSIVLVKGILNAAKPPGNPGEFDYRLFLKRKGVAWTAYWPEDSYQVVGLIKQQWNPLQWSWRVSTWASSVLRRVIVEDDSYGLIRAMILGRRDDLRGDLIDNYVASGTVHVLSVSGLHVGVFFTIISWLLGWVKRFRGGRYLYFLSLAILLIFYGLITGMPPCVQRAIIMCLTWAFADVLIKDQEAVNTLSFSAFVILLLDPYALMDVGFQLSYLAILGIILFYKTIEGLLYFDNRLMKYVWQVSALSIAAQLTTFPLSIFYFHQFPTYFLLVNPLVIALTTLLLPVTMAFLVLSFFPVAGVIGVAGQVLEWIAWLTNRSVMIPKMLPGYLLEGLYIDGYEMTGLFIALFTLWAAFYYRKLELIRLLLVSVMAICLYSSYTSYRISIDRQVIFHQIQKYFVVSVKIEDRVFLCASEGFVEDQPAFNYKLKNYLISQGIAKSNVVYVGKADEIRLGNLKIVPNRGYVSIQLDTLDICIGNYYANLQDVDYYLITNDRYPIQSELSLKAGTVFLLSGAMKKRLRDRWQQALIERGNRVHDLDQNGALSVSW